MPMLSPVEWSSPKRKEDFLHWWHHEMTQTEGDRERLERTWENALLQWRAKLPDGELDYPYPGASNLELPLTAMHADPVLADMIQSFSAAEDYWTPVAKRPDRVKQTSALREGMTAIEKRWLKMRRVNLKAFLDNNVLGTAFYKNAWLSEQRNRRRYAMDGTSERERIFVSRPTIEHVPIQRMWFPASAWSLDFDALGGAAWVAQEHRLRRDEFEALRRGSDELPGFDRDAADRVAALYEDEGETIRDLVQEEDEFKPWDNQRIRIFEVHARFPTREDGLAEDVVAWVHLESLELLRAIYFPNAHGRHPFHVINYLPGYGIYGIGLAEVDEWAQEASTQLLNATIDNARLANTRMFSAPEGARFQQDELVYPGKVWYLGPDEKIGEVRLSEVYPSGFSLLQQLVAFSELRSGVNDLRQGSLQSLPSRTPATSLLSILQEGNKRFDMIHAGIRDVHSEMGLRMIQNVAQRVKEDPFTWQRFFGNALGPDDAASVLDVLSTPDVEEIEEAFGISVTATSGSVNKEAEKQGFVGMMQVAQQIYGALIQTALLYSQTQDPVVKETAAAAYTSGVDILGQLFQRFDVQNPQQHMGNLEAISEQLLSAGGGGPQAGGMMGPMGPMGMTGPAGGIPPQALDPRALAAIFGLG